MISATLSSSRRALAALLPMILPVLLGCPAPDPQAKFDDFVDETKEERDEFAMMKRDMGAELSDINGTFLFAIEAVPVATERYLQFIATTTLEIADDGSGGTMSIEFQPLSLEQGQNLVPREPVGEVIRAENIAVSAAGTFRVESLGEMVMVTGEANPITGSDIVAQLGFEGFIQGPDLYCGNVFGDVTAPLPLSLEGSTFGAERIAATDPASLPTDIVVRCPAGGMMGGSGGSGDAGGSEGDGGSTTGG
jgi:hypothetical protein